MAGKYEWKRQIEDVTQAEVSAVIRYLDPDLGSSRKEEDHGGGVVIYVILMSLVFGSLIVMWLYP
jgi:preprotein translocase subunit SecY